MDVFKEVYRKYSPIVIQRCKRILRNEEDQVEAFQEVFYKVSMRIDEFKHLENQVGWLYKVSTNVCLNILRNQKCRGMVTASDCMEKMSDQIQVEKNIEDRDFLLSIFNVLGIREKEIFIYVYFDGMSQEDVCQLMNVSRSTLNRDLANIKERFNEQKAC